MKSDNVTTASRRHSDSASVILYNAPLSAMVEVPENGVKFSGVVCYEHDCWQNPIKKSKGRPEDE